MRHVPNGKPWTKEEMQYVIKNYGPVSAREMSEVLGRSPDSIRKFVQRYDDERLGR